ncbi:hypothetical protein ACJMK2_026407 [Sinanodonta woodiana]|uniref:THAP-type domain-containing protein n=1 Tax=Sinanodonta woodiana TaxID=1069815 RepID=A0ABD3XJH8_SINWO
MGKIYCCAKGCSNFTGKVIGERTISLHRFPTDSKLSRIWKKRVGCFRKNLNLKSTSRLCSDHFLSLAGPSKTAQVPNIFPQKTFKTWTVIISFAF